MTTKCAIVVVYKLNDALYGMSTSEFREAQKKHLIDFYGCPEIIAREFDSTLRVEYRRGFFGLMYNIALLFACRFRVGSVGCVLSSNYQLLYTRIIACWIFSNLRLILVEDGLMNYISSSLFCPNSALEKLPDALLKFLKMDLSSVLKRLDFGYFLIPDAITLNVAKKSLIVTDQRETGEGARLVDKIGEQKIFIGQPLYITGDLDRGCYFNVLERLYLEGVFDLYVRHLREPDISGDVDFPVLDVSTFGITLEAVAGSLKCSEVITFSSSLGYTLPAINKKIKSRIVTSAFYPNRDVLNLFGRLLPEGVVSELKAYGK